MKSKLFLCCTVIITALMTHGLALAGEENMPLIVGTVIDTSPGQNWPKILAAIKSVYRSLHPGDKVLVFVVRGQKTGLHASMTKTLSGHDYSDFCAIVDTVKDDWFASADITKALAGPVFQQLLQRTASKSPAMVIVITEGKVSNQQAIKLCSFADCIRNKYRWQFVITGTVRSTNRRLLAASSRKCLIWCPLAEAIDSTAMQDYINQARALTAGSTNEVAEEKLESESESQKIEPELLSETQPAEPASPTQTNEPLLTEDKASEATLAKEIKEPDKFVEKPEELLDELSVLLPELVQDCSKQEQQVLTEQETDESPVPKHRWLSKIPLLASVIGGILVVVVISVFLITAWLNAKKFQKKLLSPLEDQKKATNSKSKVLMICANGTIHRIGNLQRLNAFHIGRSNKNTVTLNNKKVASRHIRIFRRGVDLFLKNLAGTPVVIGGKELGQRKKCQLALPAIVEIANNIKIQLFWERVCNSITSENGGPK